LSVKPTKIGCWLVATMINTSVIPEYFMKKQHNQHLKTMRSYRFSPTFAHSVYTTARSLNLSESEFVRMVLTDAMDRLN